MNKKILLISVISVVAVIIIIAILFAAPVLIEYLDTTSENGNKVMVVVPEGATAKDIAGILKEKGVISSELAFRLRLKKSDGVLRWGTFELNDGMCLDDVIKVLSSPEKTEYITFTVPEGFSVQNIAQRAENLGFCTKEEFLAALDDEYDYEFIKYIPDGKYDYKLQGFLFPETYRFKKDATAHDIINVMLDVFDMKYKYLIGEYGDGLFETIIKASLIEREALTQTDRPLVAGVIENRLEIDMLLQIDASVVYAVTDGVYDITLVTKDHLYVDSPYNIYQNKGLPPGPICNPGIESIKAAINPAEHDYLYYHTDNSKGDGSHIFTKTYDEHLRTMN